jgi:hypothetical protein
VGRLAIFGIALGAVAVWMVFLAVMNPRALAVNGKTSPVDRYLLHLS